MVKKVDVAKEYITLFDVLLEAYDRASSGKGKERHATDDYFMDQPIVTEGRALGISPHIFQIRKKALEVMRMSPDAARRELLDIIVYAAAAFLITEETK